METRLQTRAVFALQSLQQQQEAAESDAFSRDALGEARAHATRAVACTRCRRAEARGGRRRAAERRSGHCRARRRVQRGTEACARVVRESGAAGRRSAAPERGRRRCLRLASSNSRYYQKFLAGIFTGSQSRRLDGHLHGREAARQALASRSRQMDSRRCTVCNVYSYTFNPKFRGLQNFALL